MDLLEFIFNDFNWIKNYKVYKYRRIDFSIGFIKPVDIFFRLDPAENEMSYGSTMFEIEKLFKSHGWDGTNEPEIIWIPPFVDSQVSEDEIGRFFWHVRMKNGNSLIASRRAILYNNIQKHNTLAESDEWDEIHILQNLCEDFSETLFDKKERLIAEYDEIQNRIIDNNESLTVKILGYYQCEIVAFLNEFI